MIFFHIDLEYIDRHSVFDSHSTHSWNQRCSLAMICLFMHMVHNSEAVCVSTLMIIVNFCGRDEGFILKL